MRLRLSCNLVLLSRAGLQGRSDVPGGYLADPVMYMQLGWIFLLSDIYQTTRLLEFHARYTSYTLHITNMMLR